MRRIAVSEYGRMFFNEHPDETSEASCGEVDEVELLELQEIRLPGLKKVNSHQNEHPRMFFSPETLKNKDQLNIIQSDSRSDLRGVTTQTPEEIESTDSNEKEQHFQDRHVQDFDSCSENSVSEGDSEESNAEEEEDFLTFSEDSDVANNEISNLLRVANTLQPTASWEMEELSVLIGERDKQKTLVFDLDETLIKSKTSY